MTIRRTLTPVLSQQATPQPAASSPHDPVDTLARTIWGEARGEPLRGQEAVAAVVMNRVAFARNRPKFWWGTTIETVCRKRWQFSCWNENDPNRSKLMTVAAGDLGFDTCLRIARRAIAGVLADPTGGATHYHNSSVEPLWAQGRAPIAEIGSHLFYRLE